MTVRLRLCRCGQHHPMGVRCPRALPRSATYDSRGYRRERQRLLEHAIRCHICGGAPTADDPLTADHVVPVSMGGAMGPLRPAHESCNKRAGQKLAQ